MSSRRLVAYLMFAAVAYHPAGYVLRVGQITFVIAALILLSLKLANARRDLASGAVLGVGLVLLARMRAAAASVRARPRRPALCRGE